MLRSPDATAESMLPAANRQRWQAPAARDPETKQMRDRDTHVLTNKRLHRERGDSSRRNSRSMSFPG